MKINVTHARAVKGFNISVSAQSDSGETIVNITTTADGFVLASDNPGAESYSKSFSQIGGWTPGANHTTTVSVLDDKGKQHRAVDSWTD